VLLVSPDEEDFRRLTEILSDTGATSLPGTECLALRCGTAKSALAELRKNHFPILVCECDLAPNSWRVLIQEFAQLPEPPLLIVTSRLADERLWAEALNLGAWDVLSKPLDTREAGRALVTAWLHWCNR
jgi:DNA-binding response OmpR family regulator